MNVRCEMYAVRALSQIALRTTKHIGVFFSSCKAVLMCECLVNIVLKKVITQIITSKLEKFVLKFA
jgi:hypothetical protein